MAAKQLDLPPQPTAPTRPTLTLPPRPSMDALFTGGLSPGPMTLLSSFFSSDSDHRSFSQLLAGAMASPIAASTAGGGEKDGGGGGERNSEVGFKQNRPVGLMVNRSPLFTVPPGLSPSGFLNSPGFFSPQSPFGMSHQQALAQVTAQAALANQTQMHMQAQYQQPSVPPPMELTHQSFATGEPLQQQIQPSTSDPQSAIVKVSEVSHSDMKHQPAPAIDKPNDDGYNWRKYGQKPIKGSDYPRSYYKCTHQNCPVKKKVERSSDGQIAEIIYRGQHNHEKPQTNKRGKDNSNIAGSLNSQANPEFGQQIDGGAGLVSKSMELPPNQQTQGRYQESLQSDPVEPLSDSEEAAPEATGDDEVDNDEPNPKRRLTEGASEVTLPHKTVTEPKIIVQTRSEVDLLDDGYRWRKYGQKVVKGNPHPRSYYRCTAPGCNVRKHVERAAADPKAVITAYEGKHNHNVPASRNGSQNTASSQVARPQPVVAKNHPLLKEMDFANNDQRPVLLRLKEEEIAAV